MYRSNILKLVAFAHNWGYLRLEVIVERGIDPYFILIQGNVVYAKLISMLFTTRISFYVPRLTEGQGIVCAHGFVPQ